MKKTFIKLFLLTLMLFVPACSCNKEKVLSSAQATDVLKQTSVSGNVKITTTTETNVNGVKTTSTQTDTYYENKYYHSSNANNLQTKTWYGSLDNVLYAFYYTKNANNVEVKTSSKIEAPLLDSTKSQLNSIIKSLFDDNGKLLDKYTISGTQKWNTYTIQVNSTSDTESDNYTITIDNAKLVKITKNHSIGNDNIITTYTYNYDVEEFDLPTLNEYPLATKQ